MYACVHECTIVDSLCTAVPRKAYYGSESGPFWLNRLQCSGDERNLLECRRKSIKNSGCTKDTSNLSPKLFCDREQSLIILFIFKLVCYFLVVNRYGLVHAIFTSQDDT